MASIIRGEVLLSALAKLVPFSYAFVEILHLKTLEYE